MTVISKPSHTQSRYQPNAYQFLFNALRYTQQNLGRGIAANPDEEEAHITGQELLEGVRQLSLERYGLMARTVFQQWGISSTADFGRIVFELIERGEMRKTDRDQLEDFFDIYDFEEALDHRYRIDTSAAFKK